MFRKFSLLFFIFAFAIVGCRQAEENGKTSTEKEAKTEQTTETTESTTDQDQADTTVDESKTVVAKVNGVPIYREDLRGFDVQKAIQKELLYQYGKDNGYLDDRIKERVANFEQSLVISKVKIDAIKDYMALNPVTAEELDQEYQKDKKEFIYLKLNEVEVTDKAIAEKIHSEAKAGGNLKDIAAKYDESQVKFQEMDRSTKRFNRFFKELKPGAVSELINNEGKYYIYKVADTNQLPTPDVKRRLRLEKEAEKKRKAINNLVEKIKQTGDYKVEMANK